MTRIPGEHIITNQLENVAINDVLPLKAARRDAIAKANLKCIWGLGHQRPNFYGYIYIHYAAPPYPARISAIYFLPFGNVWLGSRGKHNAEFIKVGENSDPILSRLWTKVHKIFRRCRKPLVLSNFLFRLSVSRFVHKIFATISLEVVEKPSECKSLLAPSFCRRDGSDFSTAIC